MLYNASTPEEYMDLLESDWRKEKVEIIRKLIKQLCPELKEGIAYKMLAYGKGDQNVFHLNAQKGYVSLYVGNIDKVENARELLKEFNMGKGCVRMKKSIDLAETKIDVFIKEVITLWRKGGTTDC